MVPLAVFPPPPTSSILMYLLIRRTTVTNPSLLSPLRGGLIFVCLALALDRLEAGSSSTNQFLSKPETLTFTDVSVEAGFFGNNSSWAAAWGDYDNDGNVDVMTLGHAQGTTNSISQLWHNNGDGTFTDVTIQTGL